MKPTNKAVNGIPKSKLRIQLSKNSPKMMLEITM